MRDLISLNQHFLSVIRHLAATQPVDACLYFNLSEDDIDVLLNSSLIELESLFDKRSLFHLSIPLRQIGRASCETLLLGIMDKKVSAG